MPPVVGPELLTVAVALRADGVTLRQIAKRLGGVVSHTTLSKALRAHDEGNAAPAAPVAPPPPVAVEPVEDDQEPAIDLPEVPDEGDAKKLEGEIARARELAMGAFEKKNLREYNALARTIGILSAQLVRIRALDQKPDEDAPAIAKAAEAARASFRRLLDEALGRRHVEKDPVDDDVV